MKSAQPTNEDTDLTLKEDRLKSTNDTTNKSATKSTPSLIQTNLKTFQKVKQI